MNLPAYQDLSKEQDAIIQLPLDGSYLIGGPPGSGKTVMALLRAKYLNDAALEPRVVMYGNLLKQYTTRAAKSLHINASVVSFHSWFKSYFENRYGSEPPRLPGSDWDYDWAAILQRLVQEPPGPGAVSHVLLDEAQDLPSQFVAALRIFLGGHLTVFADENQRITRSGSTFTELRASAGVGKDDVLFLRRNYRNTREIAELAATFYTGGPTGTPDLPTRTGPRPRIVAFPDSDSEIDRIHNYAVNFPNQSIGVFVDRTNQQIQLLDALRQRLLDAGVPATDVTQRVQTYAYTCGHKYVAIGEPGVRIVNYKSAKGLEFDTVFMPLLDRIHIDTTQNVSRMLLYVLFSRARNRLILSYSGSGAPSLARALPPALVDRKAYGQGESR